MRDEPTVGLGACRTGPERYSFLLWAPYASKVELHLHGNGGCFIQMKRLRRGYHQALADEVRAGERYSYRLEGHLERPDPASHFQPGGVHEPSEIVDPAFDWQDHDWFGLPLRDYIFYELHVGTFTEEGTFDAIISHLSRLKDLGITALELMPIAQFPGNRNWGYDGVYPFAAQNSYGGPVGLKRLVNACHQTGLALVLDVVYNHLGPEGNYLNDFGPYFTDKYHTAWGRGLNFDGPDSDEVRRFFIENALHWQTEFHVDALRLDAGHAIHDASAMPFLQELARVARARSETVNRRFYLIAESDLNDPRLISPEALGGYGLDAQWDDDFHHCLHVLLTGERTGYYTDFGGVQLFAKTLRQGFAYTGEYSEFRRRRHGQLPRGNGYKQFVVYSQNHDQVGNRLGGDRLLSAATLESAKLAAGAVILSPFIPLLFMGEEYGESAPFRYFVSHTDPELVEAVRRGRKEEFSSFDWPGAVPDPQAESNFQECILKHRCDQTHAVLPGYYRELIRLRKLLPAIREAEPGAVQVHAIEPGDVVALDYARPSALWVLLCFADEAVQVNLPLPPGDWVKLLDSQERRWDGSGSSFPALVRSEGAVALELQPKSVILLERKES